MLNLYFTFPTNSFFICFSSLYLYIFVCLISSQYLSSIYSKITFPPVLFRKRNNIFQKFFVIIWKFSFKFYIFSFTKILFFNHNNLHSAAKSAAQIVMKGLLIPHVTDKIIVKEVILQSTGR